MNESRCKFYNSFFEKHRNNQRDLFRNSKQLLKQLVDAIVKVTMPLPMILVDFLSRKSLIFDLSYAFNIPPLPLINMNKITLSRSIKNYRLSMKFLKITSELS
jgi:hypothetical protein